MLKYGKPAGKFQPQRFLIFGFLYTGFYCIDCVYALENVEFQKSGMSLAQASSVPQSK